MPSGCDDGFDDEAVFSPPPSTGSSGSSSTRLLVIGTSPPVVLELVGERFGVPWWVSECSNVDTVPTINPNPFCSISLLATCCITCSMLTTCGATTGTICFKVCREELTTRRMPPAAAELQPMATLVCSISSSLPTAKRNREA